MIIDTRISSPVQGMDDESFDKIQMKLENLWHVHFQVIDERNESNQSLISTKLNSLAYDVKNRLLDADEYAVREKEIMDLYSSTFDPDWYKELYLTL